MLQEKNFEFVLPSFSYSRGTKNSKTFKNSYGAWTVDVTSSGCHEFTGTIVFKPIIDESSFDPQQIKIIVDRKGGSHDASVTAEQRCGSMYWFGPFQSSGYSTLSFEITVRIEMPEAVESALQSLSGAKGHLKKLFESDKLADVTIKSNDKEIKVHKNILIRSEVFANILMGTSEEAETGVITLDDIEYDVLVEVFRFLYYDEIPEIKTLALKLFIVADKYLIDDLAAKCEQFLMINITPDNYFDIITAADALNKDALREEVVDYIIENRKTVFSAENWSKLKEKHFMLVLRILEKFAYEHD